MNAASMHPAIAHTPPAPEAPPFSSRVEWLAPTLVRLHVTVRPSIVDKAIAQAIRGAHEACRVPGYPLGEAPEAALVAKYGDLIGMAAGRMLAGASARQAIFNEKLIEFTTPTIGATDSPEAGRAFAYTIEFDTFPRVDAVTWQGLAVSTPEDAPVRVVAHALLGALVDANGATPVPDVLLRQAAGSRGDAERWLRAGMLLGAIARIENVKVNEDDGRAWTAKLAGLRGEDPRAVYERYRDANRRNALMARILEHKVLRLIASRSQRPDLATLFDD